VTLTESWAPLGGVNATLVNGLTVRSEYKHTRSVSLAMSSAQITENVSKDMTFGLGYKIVNFNQKIGMPAGNQKGVSHDLNLKFDMTYKNQMSLLRKITDEYTQATSGNSAWSFKFSADYQFSKMLQMKLYYDRQVNTPLISTSYPTVNSDFGMTLTLQLTR
jgi:cell surface protein SprA